MNITEIFIKRPVMTTLISVTMLFFGIYSYLLLPTSDLPAVDYPTISVSAFLPGASPDTMASSVAASLESQFTDISGLESMSSTSQQSFTSITLQFGLDRNIDAAAQDVQAAISKASLPSNMPQPPSYSKTNASASPVLYLALTSSTLPLSTVNDYAKTFAAKRMSMIKGVSQVMVYGEQKYAVRVLLDPKELANRGLSINDITNALGQHNVNLPSGMIRGRYEDLTIKSDGQLLKAKYYRPIIVSYKNGKPIRLEDLGEVVDSIDNLNSGAWWKDDKTIILAIKRQPGANTIAVVDDIKALIPEIKAKLPSSITLNVLYDLSIPIRESVNDVKFTLLLSIVLVILVVFLFLKNISATIITSLAVPMSLITTFIIMYVMNYSLDNLSLLALTLAVGFVVDDAIVMLENIQRHIEMGKPPFQATIDGAKEIGFTIISMTLSLAVVFLPIVFMSGMIGRILREFAMTISLAILISGFVSISLTPMLASRFIKSMSHKKDSKGNNEERGFFGLMLKGYVYMLKLVLRHRFTTMIIFILSLVATGYMFFQVPTGFIPSEDRGFIQGFAKARDGISFESMANHIRQTSNVIAKNPNVEGVLSIAGGGSTGMFAIMLKPTEERKKADVDVVINQLRPLLMDTPGLMVFLMNPPPISVGASSGNASYQFTLQGTDTDELYREAQKFKAKMYSLKEITDISDNLTINNPQVNITINRDRASSLGITAEQIQSTLFSGYAERQISKIYETTDQYSVILELLPNYRKNPIDLSWTYIKSQTTGKLVPINEVISTDVTLGPLQINHIGQLTSVTISFNTMPNVSIGTATKAVQDLAKATLPATITGSFQGAADEFQKSLKSLIILLIMAIAVIYVILGILYESFIHPITILAGLPSAGLGALITLYLFHAELHIYAFVGILMLIGIVKKNAIMMIDFALEVERTEGKSPRESIYQGCIERFRPIMMTTVAAFAGILPIALGLGAGGKARQPLGLAVCGGLIVSQLITLLLTPVIYTYFDELQHKLRRKAK
ncbi:MAG: efflux RND transporter permease subunit [Desulfobacterales bacterium]|nr:efflux RND transporter permease subunit [Desulfobacterales bacterium]